MDHVLTDLMLERDDGTLPQGLIMKVRPFNLPQSLNLRELNPESTTFFLHNLLTLFIPIDIDQLVTVKGLMIRGSPVIPDLKQG